jgi:hypothetical protein
MTDQMNYKIPSKLWAHATTVSIVEAALLLLEIEPQGVSGVIENLANDQLPGGYLAAKRSLVSAIQAGKLQGELIPPVYDSPIGDFEVILELPSRSIEAGNDEIDYHASNLETLALAKWLAERNQPSSVFALPDEKTGPRDETHPRYSPKLAAVVEAWESYDEASTEPGTPKQRLAKWLRLNAARFGLTRDDGSPSESVIDGLAKVANWATSGGPPRKDSEDPEPH